MRFSAALRTPSAALRCALLLLTFLFSPLSFAGTSVGTSATADTQIDEGADRVYHSVEQLLAEAFPAPQPSASMLWLNQAARDQAISIAGEDPGFRRRYWRDGDTTVWVLDVIGRDHPITVGIVVEGETIKAVDVLVYRESRGWEVRHDFFTKQFKGIALNGKKLDKRIDGITGATLSVNALQRAARLALWLHQRAIAG